MASGSAKGDKSGAEDDEAAVPEDKLVESAIRAYEGHTGQTSALVRSLGLSAIAICWLMAGGLGPDAATPQAILELLRANKMLWYSVLLATFALLADILQYAISSLLWGLYSWSAAVFASRPADTDVRFWLAYLIAMPFGLIKYGEGRAGLAGPRSFTAERRSTRFQELLVAPDMRSNRDSVFALPDAPSAVTFPGFMLFWAKTILLVASFVYLVLYLLNGTGPTP